MAPGADGQGLNPFVNSGNPAQGQHVDAAQQQAESAEEHTAVLEGDSFQPAAAARAVASEIAAGHGIYGGEQQLMQPPTALPPPPGGMSLFEQQMNAQKAMELAMALVIDSKRKNDRATSERAKRINAFKTFEPPAQQVAAGGAAAAA